MEITELQKKILEKRLIERDERFQLEDYFYTPENKIIKTYEPMKDIQESAKLINNHIQNKNIIIIATDIDCDGINSGAMGYYFFNKIMSIEDKNIKLVISSRKFARGFNSDLMKKIDIILKDNINSKGIIITADMGSYDNENYKLFKNKYPYLDIVVTDHHEIPENNYPTEANYVINPQRKDNIFGKKLCGCGVLFMLLYEIYKLNNDKESSFIDLGEQLLPFVSIATIVDMMSMKDIFNRYLIRKGLLSGNENNNRNYVNYKSLLNIPNDITYKDCSSLIGPLLNTANRVSAEEFCLASLISKDDDRSLKFLEYIQSLNKIRKKNTDICLNNFLTSYDYKYQNSYIGVIDSNMFISGSVASAISGMYLKPSIIFLNNNRDTLSGSARSGVDGLNVLDTIKSLPSDIVIDVAGHKSACGVSIYKNKLEEFRELFDKKIEEELNKLVLPTYDPEIILSHNDITINKAFEIMSVGPYGIDFPEPIITTGEPMIIKDLVPIRNFYKIVFVLANGNLITGIHFFRTNSKYNISSMNIRDIIKPGMKVQVLFYLGIDYYKRDPEPQLEIIDIIPQLGEVI